MSNALLRRNSSKQGLQNLMRLTAQRSIEDAEEIERERRRKARESLRRRTSHLTPEDSSPETEAPAERNLYDHEPKPSCSLSLEEDEGFSDWSQRKEKQRQQHLQELSQDGEEEEDEETVFLKNDVSNKALHTLPMPFSPFQKHDQDDINSIRMKVERTTDYEEEAKTVKGREEITDRVLLNTKKEIQRLNTEEEKKKEVKVSNTSKLIRCQKTTHNIPKSDIASEEVRPFMKRSNTSSRRVVESEELKPFLEAEQRLVKIRQSLQEKESQELEKMRHRQFEAEHELEELKRRREERRRAREGEERQKEEEEKQHLAVEEEERRKMREDMERRRMEAAERVKSLSTSRVDGELFSPFTPKVSAQKITERTSSLNHSLKKSNSFKKTQPLFLLTKIDDKLEQYTHAVEKYSQEPRRVKTSLTDLPNSLEDVAIKKNMFEAKETWSPNKVSTCKDTGSLKVDVANRITHWVKGPSETSSKQSSCRPSDVKPGDVLQKKNLWEIIGYPSERTELKAKQTVHGKAHKFVVTGHGKYEKVPVD